MGACFILERVRGVEPLSSPWQGLIIAAIRYPLIVRQNLGGGDLCKAFGGQARFNFDLAQILHFSSFFFNSSVGPDGIEPSTKRL